METNNINIGKDDNELEQMREQLEIMKQKLSRQEIVSDNLLRRSMSNLMSWIKKYVWLEIFVMIPFVAIIYAGFVAVFNISLWLYAVILVSCIVDTYSDYRINKMSQSDWLEGNLVETGRKLLKMKRQRKTSFIISMAAMLVILGYFCYEMFNVSDPELKFIGSVGSVIGAVCGIAAVSVIYRKMQRTNDELIHQIDELGRGIE